MYFHKPQVAPRLYGNFQTRQYSIWRNLEDIYRCDHESEVLIIPGFWGFPLFDYSKYGNDGTNYGSTFKDGSLSFDGDNDYVKPASDTLYNDSTWEIQLKFLTNYANNQARFFSANYVELRCPGAGDFLVHGRVHDGVWREVNTGTLGVNIWYDIVLTWGGSNVILYKDGEEIQRDTNYDGTVAASSYAHSIGSSYTYNVYFTHAFINSVRIAKAARTPDQIALFHDNPYGLYQPVAKPFYSIPAAPSLYIPQIIMF